MRVASGIIALLSDFGSKDYFVGAMKGAILSINPNAKIVDITHEVPPQDVRTAAFVLVNAARTFPPGSIFLCVVDPGVGTERKCILLKTKNRLLFIGPDNGLFTLVAERFGVAEAREITNRALMGREISHTFHGRDVFAPIAAHISLGARLSDVGPKLSGIKMLEIPRPKLTATELRGCVMNIDHFGNLITNIDSGMASGFAKSGETLEVMVGKERFLVKVARTFGEVGPGERLCYVGSAGMLEIGENMGNLASKLKVKIDSELTIRRVS